MLALEGVLADIVIGQVFHLDLDSMVSLMESLTLMHQEPTVFGGRLLSVVRGSNGEDGPGDCTDECDLD
jgi:hypothetical protein